MKNIIAILILLNSLFFYGNINKIDSLNKLLINSTHYQKDSIYSSIATIHRSNGDYSEAINCLYKALNSALIINNNERIAISYNGLGGLYNDIGNYEKSLSYYIKAQNYFEKTDNELGLAGVIDNIGMVYSALGDYNEAIKYHHKALKLFVKLDNKLDISIAYNNLGIASGEIGELDNAIKYFTEAYNIALKNGDKKTSSYSINNIAIVYYKQNNLDKALEYLYKTIKNVSNENEYGSDYNNIGRIYLDMEKLDSASKYLNKALIIAQNSKANYLLLNCYINNIDLNIKLNNYKKALEYQQLYQTLNDSIYSIESKNKIAELKIIYETEQKEKENQLLKQKNEINKLETKRNINFRNYLIILSILLIIIVIIIYNRYRLKQKINKLLLDKNKALITENKKLKFSESTLKELNESKDMFYNELAMKIQNLHTDDSDNNNTKITEKEIDLSKRELEIFKFIANGFSNKEIAEALFISVRTVEKHKSNILQKLELNSVVDLVKFAVKNGLTEV